MNCKRQTRPQDRGHMTFSGLRFVFFREKPDANGLYYDVRANKIFQIFTTLDQGQSNRYCLWVLQQVEKPQCRENDERQV